MHRPTVEASELSWWQIKWATENVVFTRTKVTAGYNTNKPEDYQTKENAAGMPLGGVNHQNTCGHGYMPSMPTTFANGAFGKTHDNSNLRTLLGASPSEINIRGKHKRWSDN